MTTEISGELTLSISQNCKSMRIDDPNYEYTNCRLILLTERKEFINATSGIAQRDT